MKRRIVQHGSSSLTVSLPYKWASKYHLKKGDEVEVRESGKSLMLSIDSGRSVKTCTLRIKESDLFFKRDIINLYKRGYDEIVLEFEDVLPISEVLDKIDELLGFEIVEQGSSSCTIRNVASLEESQFDAMLRRLFLVTISFAEECYSKIRARTYSDLAMHKKSEKENNKLANSCQRLLIRKGFDDLDYTTSTYSVIDQIEMIGDAYGDLSEYLVRARSAASAKVLSFFKDLNAHFREVYITYYKNDRRRLSDLKKSRVLLYQQIQDLLESSQKSDVIILRYLKQVLESLHHIEFSLVKA